jgi:hypothetical protein
MPYPAFVKPSLLLSAFIAVAAALPAQAQTPQAQAPQTQAPQAQPRQPAPPKAYKPIPVTVAKPYDDPSFAAFRKELSDIASKKDRAALAKVTAANFFWIGEKGDKADKKKSGIDNLAAAIELDDKEGAGWEALKAAAAESTLEPVPERKGILCSPANPTFDEAAADAVAKETGTDPAEWGYVTKADAEVRGAAKADAPVIDKLGQNLVRILPEEQPAPAAGAPLELPPFLRVVTPAGKVGYVSEEVISPLGTDQLCYTKDGGAWKIAGYAGND